MQFEMDVEELQANDGLMARLLIKLKDKVKWEASDFSRSDIQWLLDNGKKVDRLELYSPVLSQSVLNTTVPASWPGQPVDDEGELIPMSFGDYLRVTEVVGGFVLQFSDGPKGARNQIVLPRDARLRAQITKAGGFLTKAEVDAIKVVEVG